MADQTGNKSKSYGKVDEASISLSQAILSPLDALFKAQIHAARSFLNLVLQIGYPHDITEPVPENADGSNVTPAQAAEAATSTVVPPAAPQKPWTLDFTFSVPGADGIPQDHVISIPALALVPLNSLTIDSAEFKFGLNIQQVSEHQQVQDTRAKADAEAGKNPDMPQKRDWYLVKEPVSLQGHIASNSSGKESYQSQTTVDIAVKVSKAPMPAALDKLLTALTQNATITKTT